MNWISVEDKLPPLRSFGQAGGWVLVAYYGPFSKRVFRARRLEDKHGNDWFWDTGNEHEVAVEYIKYWMPLPEVPEE